MERFSVVGRRVLYNPGSYFIENVAFLSLVSASIKGGAFYCSDSNISPFFQNCIFTNCSSSEGGAIYALCKEFVLKNGKGEACTAKNGQFIFASCQIASKISEFSIMKCADVPKTLTRSMDLRQVSIIIEKMNSSLNQANMYSSLSSFSVHAKFTKCVSNFAFQDICISIESDSVFDHFEFINNSRNSNILVYATVEFFTSQFSRNHNVLFHTIKDCIYLSECKVDIVTFLGSKPINSKKPDLIIQENDQFDILPGLLEKNPGFDDIDIGQKEGAYQIAEEESDSSSTEIPTPTHFPSETASEESESDPYPSGTPTATPFDNSTGSAVGASFAVLTILAVSMMFMIKFIQPVRSFFCQFNEENSFIEDDGNFQQNIEEPEEDLDLEDMAVPMVIKRPQGA